MRRLGNGSNLAFLVWVNSALPEIFFCYELLNHLFMIGASNRIIKYLIFQ